MSPSGSFAVSARRRAASLTSPAARRVYIVLAILLIIALWANMVHRALTGSSQFDDFVTFSRDLVYQGINVYEEYPDERSITKYPPLMGFLFVPLVPIPLVLAAALWFLVNLGFSVGAAYFSVRTVEEQPGGGTPALSLFVVPYVLAAGIIGSNLETGQVNLLILFFLCLALYTFRRGADLTAGLLLGLVTALKLTPGLFIAYFAYKKSHRVVAGAALGVVVGWLVLPSLVFGIDESLAILRAWYRDVVPYLVEGARAEPGGFRYTNQSFSAVLHRFATRTPVGLGREDLYLNVASLGHTTARWVVRGAVAVVLGALAWLCRTRPQERHDLRLAFEYSLVMIAALFISPVSWINHYVVLLFPFTASFYYVHTRPASLADRRWLTGALGVAFVLVSSSVATLPQALSLPFVGALVLAVSMAAVLARERSLGDPEPGRRNRTLGDAPS